MTLNQDGVHFNLSPRQVIFIFRILFPKWVGDRIRVRLRIGHSLSSEPAKEKNMNSEKFFRDLIFIVDCTNVVLLCRSPRYIEVLLAVAQEMKHCKDG